MSWTRLELQTNDPLVERQLGGYWCGAACAAMMLRDRDIHVTQLMIARGLRKPCTGRELAERLNECSWGKREWFGGQLDLDAPLQLEHVRELGRRGSWAAQLIRDGELDGHWVVVDDVIRGLVTVRDPDGSRYKLPWNEFVVLVRFMAAVFEGGG